MCSDINTILSHNYQWSIEKGKLSFPLNPLRVCDPDAEHTGNTRFILEKWGVHILCVGYQCELVGPLQLDFSQNPAEENIYEAKWYTKEELLEESILRAPEMMDAVALVEISE